MYNIQLEVLRPKVSFNLQIGPHKIQLDEDEANELYKKLAPHFQFKEFAIQDARSYLESAKAK